MSDKKQIYSMAILGPSNLPVVLKVASEQMKMHAMSQLGYPVVGVEITEKSSQFGPKTMLYHYRRSQYSAIKPEKGDSKIELVYMRVK